MVMMDGWVVGGGAWRWRDGRMTERLETKRRSIWGPAVLIALDGPRGFDDE